VGSGLSELSEKGNLCVPVSGEGKDRDDSDLDGSKVTINEFRLVGELEDNPIIGPQPKVNKMERQAVDSFSHLRIRNVVSHVGKCDSILVTVHPIVKFFSECLVYPVALFLVFPYKGFGVWNKTFQHDLTFVL
jgi:hypothetical protein